MSSVQSVTLIIQTKVKSVSLVGLNNTQKVSHMPIETVIMKKRQRICMET